MKKIIDGNFGNMKSFLSFVALKLKMEIKERIKQKADELFMRYGIKSITMDEIANQLGISKKTIYQSFADKDELVDEVVGELLTYNQNCCNKDRAKATDAIHEVFQKRPAEQVVRLHVRR